MEDGFQLELMSRFQEETLGHSYLDIACNYLQTYQLNSKPEKKIPFISTIASDV